MVIYLKQKQQKYVFILLIDNLTLDTCKHLYMYFFNIIKFSYHYNQAELSKKVEFLDDY